MGHRRQDGEERQAWEEGGGVTTSESTVTVKSQGFVNLNRKHSCRCMAAAAEPGDFLAFIVAGDEGQRA
jgi:hypothetical protein